jgi:hypothetical protein
MEKILSEFYFIDLDAIEQYLDIPSEKKKSSDDDELEDTEESSNNEIRVNVVKFELVKMLLDTVLTEDEGLDDKLAGKGSSNLSIPFKLAFNSLVQKKLINHY